MPQSKDLALTTARTLKETVKGALSRGRIGFEGNFGTVSANHVGGEIQLPTAEFFNLVKKSFDHVTFIDATEVIYRIRSLKGSSDIRGMKSACQGAIVGLSAALSTIREGVKECAVAAAAEAEVRRSMIGFKGAKRARAYAFVMSGPNAGQAYRPFEISSERKLKDGDLVLLEFNVLVDGYWSDVTRVWTCGKPSKEQLELYGTVYESFRRTNDMIRDGSEASQLFELSNRYLYEQGLGRYTFPFLGHGIGVGLHEPIPMLVPQSSDVLKSGMVHTVEPGVYMGKQGAIRIEDVILVNADGHANLSETEYGLDVV